MHALLSFNDNKYQVLADRTWNQNKKIYAEQHGYFCDQRTEDKFTTNPMNSFEKIYHTKEMFEQHPEIEWAWYTGCDTMVTNFTIKIEDKIDNNYHFMICVDANGINADSYLARNTPEGMEFLNHVLSLQEECMQYWDQEQRALCYACGLPAGGGPEIIPPFPTGNDIIVCDRFKNTAKILPQRHMNTYKYDIYVGAYLDKLDKFGVNGDWVKGDWLIHWPSTTLQDRLELFDYYQEHIVK
jgi:hypothetical protein